VTTTGYLLFPHIHDDLLCFVAEDDVWIAPAGGGRAWRLSADNAAASHPRFTDPLAPRLDEAVRPKGDISGGRASYQN
jgi:tricorn protease-like protein